MFSASSNSWSVMTRGGIQRIMFSSVPLWHRLGNRAAVVKQYYTLSRLLADELAADPMPETQTLYTELAG
jgi:hypothetical protein